jgi:hypothetical protein
MKDAAPQRDGDGFGAIAGAQLREKIPDVHFDGVFRYGQLGRDLLVALSGRDKLQDFEFARAELVVRDMLGERLGQRRWDTALSCGDRADDVQEFLANHAFGNVPLRARIHRFSNVGIAFVGAENDYFGVRKFRSDRADRIKTAHIGQAEIHERDIGPDLPILLQCLSAR